MANRIKGYEIQKVGSPIYSSKTRKVVLAKHENDFLNKQFRYWVMLIKMGECRYRW